MSSALDAPARSLYRHNLMGLLDQALRLSAIIEPKVSMTCWASDDKAPFDFIGRLDVRLLTAGGATERDVYRPQVLDPRGWDIFLLEYHVESSPLTAVMNREAMNNYTRIFAHLWGLKRSEVRCVAMSFHC